MEEFCVAEKHITEELHFKSVDFDTKDVLEFFFHTYPSRSSDFTLGGVLMWAELFQYRYAIYDNSLFIMGKYPGTDRIFFHWPIGEISESEFLSIVEDFAIIHHIDTVDIMKPTEVTPQKVDEYDSQPMIFARSWEEYLYDIERFRTFSGKKMSKKRNHLNYFLSNYPNYTVENISPSNFSELMAFTLNFEAGHADSELSDYENRQVNECLRRYDEFPYFGIVLRVDGEIIGFSFGESIDDTFSVHVEKGNVDFRGVYQAIAFEVAKAVAEKYPQTRFLNREDDMGVENLRNSKESYHPSLFICKEIIKIHPTKD